jgi:hypothetical protein
MRVSAPLTLPEEVGVNVTAITQLAPPATGVEVEQVVLASTAKLALTAKFEIVRGAVPVFITVTLCAVLVVPTTCPPKLRLEGVILIATSVPVPLRLTVWVLPTVAPLLSVKVSVAVALPVTVGANVTPTAQVPAGATAAPVQVFELMAKLAAFVPESATVATFNVAPPELVTVMTCAGAVDPITVAPNVTDAEDRVASGAVPLPLRDTVCGLPEALSVKVSVAEAAPVTVGLKVRPTTQVALGATLAPLQVLVATANSEAFAPPNTTVEILSAMLPPLVTVSVIGALVVPISWLLKLTLAGDAENVAAVPVPLKEAVCGLFAESALTWSVPAALPMAVGEKVMLMEQLAPAASEVPQVVLEIV